MKIKLRYKNYLKKKAIPHEQTKFENFHMLKQVFCLCILIFHFHFTRIYWSQAESYIKMQYLMCRTTK